MAQRRQTVTLGLKEPTLRMFPNVAHLPPGERRNEIMIDFDDPGWIAVRFLAKQPGPTMKLREVEMTFNYEDSFHRMHELEGYERLILEAMLGDQSLFTRSDEIERLWDVATPLLENPPPVEFYEPGSLGARIDQARDLALPLVPARRQGLALNLASSNLGNRAAVLQVDGVPAGAGRTHPAPDRAPEQRERLARLDKPIFGDFIWLQLDPAQGGVVQPAAVEQIPDPARTARSRPAEVHAGQAASAHGQAAFLADLALASLPR